MKLGLLILLLAGVAALGGCATRESVVVAQVAARAETTPAPSAGDAADDAAVWVHPSDPASSLILGTDKQTGLYVYAPSGAVAASLPAGRFNNVDLRTFGPAFDYAAASDRTPNAVALFRIDRKSGAVSSAGSFPTNKIEPYGICVARLGSMLHVFVTYKDGVLQEFRLSEPGDPATARLAATAQLGSQLEGCVADEPNDRLFVGEEAKGLWAFKLSDISAPPILVDHVKSGHGLAADVEGVSIWRAVEGKGWLVVSAQGKNRYVVYDRMPPFAPRGVFEIASGSFDAVSETDGIDISSASLGEAYPRGVLVAQDGLNTNPAAFQNFKIVDWRDIEKALALPALEPEKR